MFNQWSDTRVITGWALIAATFIAFFAMIAVVQTSPQNTLTTCIERTRQPLECREAIRP